MTVEQAVAYQQRLEVANRVLRHNLRNDMNVVAGNAEIVRDRIDATDDTDTRGDAPSDRDTSENTTDGTDTRGDTPNDTDTSEETNVAVDAETNDDRRVIDEADAVEIGEAAATIRETATQLLATSEKAREMANLPEVDREHDSTELVEPTRATVRAVRDRAPDATITVDAPASVTAVVGGRDRYRTALRNLVDNAIDHHDGTPHVTVRLVDGDPVRVTVADDGPGLPAEERRTFAAGRETDLQHASGLGLWLVYWVTTGVGGDLSFADRDPRGTAVTMSLPAGDRDE